MPRMDAPIGVVIGVFEDLVAIGLERLISRDEHMHVVASGVALEDLDPVLNGRADVLLLNYDGLPSVRVVEELHTRHPETRVVVLASSPSTLESVQILSLGAAACMGKETQARDIINAIHLASRDMRIMPSSGTSEPSRALDEVEATDLLTPREEEVLGLLRAGRTNAQIAQSLYISIETVRTHAQRIYRKLGVSSRRQLMKLGVPGSPSARSSAAR